MVYGTRAKERERELRQNKTNFRLVPKWQTVQCFLMSSDRWQGKDCRLLGEWVGRGEGDDCEWRRKVRNWKIAQNNSLMVACCTILAGIHVRASETEGHGMKNANVRISHHSARIFGEWMSEWVYGKIWQDQTNERAKPVRKDKSKHKAKLKEPSQNEVLITERKN